MTISILLFSCLFSGVSFGFTGLNSPFPVAVSFEGFTPQYSIKKCTTFVALLVDNSQFDGNWVVLIGRLSVCPCTIISLSSLFKIFPSFFKISFADSLISALLKSNKITESNLNIRKSFLSIIFICSFRPISDIAYSISSLISSILYSSLLFIPLLSSSFLLLRLHNYH